MPVTCPTCYGVFGGCVTCEGSGTVATVPERVTFAEAVALVYQEQWTGAIHFLHGRPQLVRVEGITVRITA